MEGKLSATLILPGRGEIRVEHVNHAQSIVTLVVPEHGSVKERKFYFQLWPNEASALAHLLLAADEFMSK